MTDDGLIPADGTDDDPSKTGPYSAFLQQVTDAIDALAAYCLTLEDRVSELEADTAELQQQAATQTGASLIERTRHNSAESYRALMRARQRALERKTFPA